MKEYLPIIGFALILLLVVGGIMAITYNQHIDYIKNWAKENGHTVQSIDEHFFRLGPYYYKNKGSRIYELKTEEGRTFWFRTGIFSHDVEEYDG